MILTTIRLKLLFIEMFLKNIRSNVSLFFYNYIKVLRPFCSFMKARDRQFVSWSSSTQSKKRRKNVSAGER